MSKKIKILSALACGVLLSSSLSFTNVQAAEVKINSQNKIMRRAIINKDVYSPYCILKGDAREILTKYFKNADSPSVTGVRDLLVRENLASRTVANNIAYSLYSLGTQCKNKPFVEVFSSEISVLQPGKQEGAFTVGTYNKEYPMETFSVYAVLTADEFKCIADIYEKKDGFVDRDELAQYLINNNITSDFNVANNIVAALYTCYGDEIGELDLGENILVMQSNDTGLYYLARLPR
ncbi:hypothetical protein [Clostridium cochlearium]|uniref:Uncharacterized protein n=1 Tax=Clostridium cochlearium TaxID=1494 RepID=A0A7Y3V571_CLOCO|nr:hypothetical protein [Clostridium cochlearium]NOH14892.1 hypothetical protein [Clostridium cochlearium]